MIVDTNAVNGLGEFRFGIAASRYRGEYEAWLDSQLRHFDILPVTDETAMVFATLGPCA